MVKGILIDSDSAEWDEATFTIKDSTRSNRSALSVSPGETESPLEHEDTIDSIGYNEVLPSDSEEIVEGLEGDGLTEISGIGIYKSRVLKEAGYETIADVKNAEHSELSEIDEIGNALAARIKADVGERVTEEHESVEFLDEGTLAVNMYE